MNSNEIDKLVEEFSSTAKKYYECTLEGDSQKVNKQSLRMTNLFKQIIGYGVPGREALLSLTESETPVTAQMAATYSLKYSPEKCKSILTVLAKRQDIIGFGASQTLLRWEEGAWKLEE